MARILIGNIKGPKGDTGPRGATGPAGPIGPQGPLPPLTNNFLATVAGQSALDAAAGKVLKDQLDQQNSDIDNIEAGLESLSPYTVDKTGFGVPLTARISGKLVKSLDCAGTQTTTMVADTEYTICTCGGIYAPKYGWTKRIIYKTVGGTPHIGLLAMDTNGRITFTPLTVASGGTIRINELYM